MCLGPKRQGVSCPCGPTAKKNNLLSLIKTTPEKEQKDIIGSALSSLVKSEKQQPYSYKSAETFQLGRVSGGHSVSVTVGKLDTQPKKVLTTETFRKIEVEMELGRNSILKLKRILGQVVTVEIGAREALRS